MYLYLGCQLLINRPTYEFITQRPINTSQFIIQQTLRSNIFVPASFANSNINQIYFPVLIDQMLISSRFIAET